MLIISRFVIAVSRSPERREGEAKQFDNGLPAIERRDCFWTLSLAMTAFLVILMPLFLPAPSHARTLTSIDLIENAYRSREIDYGKALDYKVAAVLRPDALPERFRSRTPIKSATLIMMEARANRHLLSPENARLLTRGRDNTLMALYGSKIRFQSTMRRDLKDPADPFGNTPLYDSRIELKSIVSPNSHFRIHYTTEGDDAVPATDDDGNGIPDYVDKFAWILDHVWDREVNEMGYDAPPSDGVEGGDCLLDVYLANIPAYGFTQVDEGMPVSTVYMIFENDFAEPDFPWNSNPGGVQEGDMKVTAAHEFFHAIQFQITDDIPLNGWWMEASATWMEDHVYPEVDDYVNYISYWFQNPDFSLNTFDGYFEYGASVWVKHLTEKYGAEFVFDIWNNKIKAKEFPINAIKNSLVERGTTIEEEIKELRVANVTLTYDDGQLYTKRASLIYDTVYPDFATTENIPDVPLDPLAAVYYSFNAPGGDGSLNIDFDGNGNISVMVIGIRPGNTCSGDICYDVSEMLTDLLNKGSITIKGFSSNGPYTRVVVIPLNYSATDTSSFSLTVAYSAPSPNSAATVAIRPAATTSVVTGDGGSGKQQYSLILRDGNGNQVLESGASWTADSSSLCTASSSVCVDSNGFATAAKAISGAAITASLSGLPPVSASYTAGNPASMTPGVPRNCTISHHSDGRCFIATAAFGSPLHPYVQILREFRDRYLLTNDAGRKMVALYYFYSPLAAKAITEDATLRTGVQISLIPVIIFSAFMVKASMVEKIIVGTLLLIMILYVIEVRKHCPGVRL